jgi:hypothetical protein
LLREIQLLKEYITELINSRSLIENEKFAAVEQRFDLAEQQRIEQKADTKAAVDAALAAAKEAVKEQTIAGERAIMKSETAVTKQLDQQQQTFKSDTDGLRRSIDEQKDRVTELDRIGRESIGAVDKKVDGLIQQKAGIREDHSGNFAMVGLVVSVIVMGLVLLGLVLKYSH